MTNFMSYSLASCAVNIAFCLWLIDTDTTSKVGGFDYHIEVVVYAMALVWGSFLLTEKGK